MMNRSLAIGLLALTLLGIGCSEGDSLFGTSRPADSEITKTTDDLEFIPGDQFTIKQTVLGNGGVISSLATKALGERTVTVTRFAPEHTAALDWSMSAERETEASKKAREAYEASLKEGKVSGLPPKPEFETITATGTVSGISLSAAHTAQFPSYWQAGIQDLVGEKSGVWLSQDAYQELKRTGKTVLNIGVFDEAFQKATKGFTDIKEAVDALRKEADQAEANQDLTLLQVDPTVTEYTLELNGKKVTVNVLKAKNWFGEYLILDNEQNPLILKATLSPLKSGLADALSGMNAFYDKFFGYEVSAVTLKR